MSCRHCKRNIGIHARGLCWRCHQKPDVRERYQATSKFGRRGIGNFCGTGQIPEPTTTEPGTEERLRVLEARAASGQALFHPDDRALGDIVPWAVPCSTGHSSADDGESGTLDALTASGSSHRRGGEEW